MSDPRPCLRSEGTEIEAARLVLARMGIEPTQLLEASPEQAVAPTFAEYIPRVSEAVNPGTRRAYGSYWKRVIAVWGGRHLDELAASDIKKLAAQTKSQAAVRQNTRGGRSAAEHLIAALRCVYNHAEADGLIKESDNPARRVSKPRRLSSNRRGLPDGRLRELNDVAASTGNDPSLDALLLRLHTETACRRGGALALRQQDLDVEQSLIYLREKGDTTRWQPVSPTLMHHLQTHAAIRGVTQVDQPLLRYATGKPLTARRYDYLWQRLRKHLSWAAKQQISTHWLRHTTLTWVERNFGYAVARAYAGHTGTNDTGVTTTYVRADLSEIATALASMTGEPHPLSLQ